jgi:hypothetical protein
MERTTTSRFDPRAALALLGLVFVVAAVWAASALASGGSSGTPDWASGSSGNTPESPFVQDSNGNGAAPSRDDCPDHGGSGGDTAPSDGSGTSGNDL